MRPSTVVVIDGQSLNQYPPSVTTPTVYHLMRSLNVPLKVAAQDGQGWASLTPTRVFRRDPHLKTSRNSVLVMNGGTADLSAGTSAAGILELMRAYAQSAHDVGCDRVIACTITGWVGISGALNTVRTDLNALILSKRGDPAYWEDCVDITADARFQNPADTTYFIDGLHFTAAGHLAQAQLMLPVIQSVLSTLNIPDYKG